LAAKHQARDDSLNYEVTGAASVDLPFLRSIAFHQSGSLPLSGFYKQLN
jgi:hypothetical protein